MAPDHDVDDRLRRRVLWALPTGLYVIGSRADTGGEVRRNLMTANLVVQVSVEPKLVAVAVDTAAVTAGLIEDGGAFSVNLLARQDRTVVRRFVKPVTDVALDASGALVAMAGEAAHDGRTGVPLLDGAVAHLECALRHRLPLGSHVLFVGEVVAVDGPDGELGEILRMEDTRMNYGG